MAKKKKTSKKHDPLKLEVAPNIVEHLGLNLYTDLPRVLVEFVANAYDADSKYVDIQIDADAINETRRQMREAQIAKDDDDEDSPLSESVLPSHLKITIEDRGHGMKRDDIQQKFLRIARKRRDFDGDRSPGQRIVMGRKGIGKLAGFGVAHRMEVTTKAKGEAHATRFTLIYGELIGMETTENVDVHEEKITSNIKLGTNGTRVVLSDLVYEPTGSQLDTIKKRIGEHFAIISSDEFEIRINGEPLKKPKKKFEYCYPQPELAAGKLVKKTLELDDGGTVDFKYRVRFTEKSLKQKERGIRVYARKRLAAAPDLLDLGTGMHGFQNTHYLEGEAHADFIDQKRADYISSDRQSLRWETPFLSALRNFLTDEMHDAVVEYQKTKEATIRVKVLKDKFTLKAIEKANLPKHRKDTAFKIAAKLAAGCGDTTKDQYYKETLPVIVRGLGYGELLSAITTIAKSKHPSFPDVVTTVSDLTSAEWDDFSKVIDGRLKGIETLRRIYKKIDFKDPKNENELHRLLEDSPWLIDPTFWQFLSSDETEDTMNERLAKKLKIGKFVPNKYDATDTKEAEPYKNNRRPDLVFLLNNFALGRLVIVELKAPNTPLLNSHLQQLTDYMRNARNWIKQQKGKAADLKVEGYLIGERDDPDSSKLEVERLREAEGKRGVGEAWQVFGIGELLERAEDAHRELLNVQKKHILASSKSK